MTRVNTPKPTKQKPDKRVKAGTSKASAAIRRVAFVEAFLSNGGNATKAAHAAGFSPHTAGRQGGRLLKDIRIQAELDKRRTEIAVALVLSTEQTLRETARIAFSDPRKIVDKEGKLKRLEDLDADTAAAIASIEFHPVNGIKYRFWDKNSALERAAKILGLFERDNKQRTDPLREFLGSLSGNVLGVVNVPDDDSP